MHDLVTLKHLDNLTVLMLACRARLFSMPQSECWSNQGLVIQHLILEVIKTSSGSPAYAELRDYLIQHFKAYLAPDSLTQRWFEDLIAGKLD